MGELELKLLVWGLLGWLIAGGFYILQTKWEKSARRWKTMCLEVSRKCERDHPDTEPMVVRRRCKGLPDAIVSVRCPCGEQVPDPEAVGPVTDCVACGRWLDWTGIVARSGEHYP